MWSGLFFYIISSFAEIILTSIVVWMVGILVLMLREMFSNEDLRFSHYLYKVWRILLFSFEFVAYGFVVVAPIMMVMTKKYTEYMITTFVAVILSSAFLFIRKKTVGFRLNKKNRIK